MKKRRFLASIVLIVSALAVVTSCQQEEENFSSGKSSLRYLSVAEGYLDDVSFYPNDSNTVNYSKAIERLFGFSDKGIYAKAASASEVNMSQELYDYLTSNFISPQIKTRTNSDDDKTLSENDYDCVACTIAEVYCELASIMDYKTKKIIYKQAWELICRVNGQGGLLWGVNGYWYNKILRACFEDVEQFVRPTIGEIYFYLKEPSMKVIESLK